MSLNKSDKSFQINFSYGQNDIHKIIDELAEQTVIRNVNEFNNSNLRVKKMPTLGRVS